MANAYAYFPRLNHVPRPRLQQSLSENDAELIRSIIRNEIQLSETRIKTEIKEINNKLETLSKQSSMLSEESVRRKVAMLNGESWAESITFKSLDDLVAFIYPSLPQKNKLEVSECKVLLARHVHPLLGMYLDRVKAYLKDYSNTLDDAAEQEKLKNVLAIKDDEKLVGQLISFFGTNIKNETWRNVLVRFKKASHLIKVEKPTNDQLQALLSESGPGIFLACGAAEGAFEQRKHSHWHERLTDLLKDTENPFKDMKNPFTEMKSEIEVRTCSLFYPFVL